LELFVPADGDVVGFGALPSPIILPRPACWDDYVSEVAGGQDLAAGFVREARAGAEVVLAAARQAAQERIIRAPSTHRRRQPQRVDAEWTWSPGLASLTALRDQRKTRRYQWVLPKPSDGLEPSTPSLPSIPVAVCCLLSS
jgi:hypothetical protein